MVRRKAVLLGASGLVGFCGILAAVFWAGREEGPGSREDRPQDARVDRVINGHKVKLETDGGPDEELVYAGIRAPYPQEPLFEESRRRNAELVEGKEVRLRFDKQERDREDRLYAYVSVEGTFVNEALVREGLAYVRLTPDTQRFAEQLLAAQTQARQEKRGLWKKQSASDKGGYLADPKYGNFHLSTCSDAADIKPERIVVYKSRDEALDAGLAPCPKCTP